MIFDRPARDLNIIERNRAIGELLVSFVSFACDQDNVARPGQLDRAGDRGRSIDNFLVLLQSKTFLDFGNNGGWIFFARIIGSDDGVIGISLHDLGHERALLPIAIAAATEDDEQATGIKFT